MEKQLEGLIHSALDLTKEAVVEMVREKIKIGEEQRRIRGQIVSEYYILTGRFPDISLDNYIGNAVSEWREIHQKYGEKAGYKCVTLKLEEAKTKFTLEPAVVDYLDKKIEEFREKVKT